MLHVTEHDNRGTKADPFGYVYFSDGVRMIYSPHTSGLSNPLGLFPSKGGGRPMRTHFTLATIYLTDQGIS